MPRLLKGAKKTRRDNEMAIRYMQGVEPEELARDYALSMSATRQILHQQYAFRPGEVVKQWSPESRARWRARDEAIIHGHNRHGLTPEELAKRFTISEITVRKILNKEPHMHKHKGLDAVEETAARFGFFKRRMPPDFRMISWHLRCSKCPAELSCSWGPNMNPEGMAKFTKQKGWDVGLGDRPICPDCMHSRNTGPVAKPEHQSFKPYIDPQTLISTRLLAAANERALQARLAADEAQAQQELPHIEAPVEAPVEAPQAEHEHRNNKFSEEARAKGHTPEARAKAIATRRARIEARNELAERARQVREADRQARCGTAITNGHAQEAPQAEKEDTHMQMPPKVMVAVTLKLAGLFDKEKGQYRYDYSDKRVAEECAAPIDQVIALRKEAFGELAEDPRITQLSSDVEALRQMLADAVGKLEEITRS